MFEGGADDGAGVMIEAFADGWWYTAAIPEGRRVVACMTDADLVRSLDVQSIEGFMRALGGPITCAPRRPMRGQSDRRKCGPPARAASPVAPALPLLCVGDAAVMLRSGIGQGIFKALRSGIFASYAIADLLRRNDESGVTRYRQFVADEFSAYRKTLHDYYALEQRWADRPFWRRRGGRGRRARRRVPLRLGAIRTRHLPLKGGGRVRAANRVGVTFNRTKPKTALARRLRRTRTDVEMRLWQKLRNRQLGADFRRQHPACSFVLDFYCPSLRLAIELDGGQHAEAEHQAKDQQRDRWLEERGVVVMRFWNSDITDESRRRARSHRREDRRTAGVGKDPSPALAP